MSTSFLPPPPLLPAPFARAIGVVAVLAALVVLALALHYAGHTEPGAFDAWVQPALSESVNSAWSLAIAIDFLGEPVGSVLVMVALVGAFAFRRQWRAVALALAGPVLTIAFTSLGKPVVGRTIHTIYLSFPSGHTGFVTSVALVPALVFAGRSGASTGARLLLVLAAALVAALIEAWAQVGLSAHYATDTIAGFCTALAVVPATAWLVDRVAARTTSSSQP